MEISGATVEDSGQYTVKAKNAGGESEVSVEVTVNEADDKKKKKKKKELKVSY